jgi:hypothetical protein
VIDQKMIPPEVVEAALSAYNYASSDCYTAEEQDIATAIAAGLAAWPGMEYWPEFSDAGLGEHAPGKVFLPLPQGARDE